MSVSSLHSHATEISRPRLKPKLLSKAHILFCLQTCLLLLLSLQPQILRKKCLLFCHQTCLLLLVLLCLSLQPQFLRYTRLLFCLQTCLLLGLILQPHLLSNECLLFSHQPCTFFCSIPCRFDITRGSSLVVTHRTADVQVTSDRQDTP